MTCAEMMVQRNLPQLSLAQPDRDIQQRDMLARMVYNDLVCKDKSVTMNIGEISKLIESTDKSFSETGPKSFLSRYPNLFHVTRDLSKGTNVVKPIVSIKFCKKFDGKKGCTSPECPNLHVCRHYIKDKCTFGANCKKPHHFKDPHTRRLLAKHYLAGLDDSQLKEFLCSHVQFPLEDAIESGSLPKHLEICKYYNVAIGCSREESCPFLHICRFYAEEGSCKFGEKCIRRHDFSNSHAQKLLERYNIPRDFVLEYLRIRIPKQLGTDVNNNKNGIDHYTISESIRNRLNRNNIPCNMPPVFKHQNSSFPCLTPHIFGNILDCNLAFNSRHRLAYSISNTFAGDFMLPHESRCIPQGARVSICKLNILFLWQVKVSVKQISSWKTFTPEQNEQLENEFSDVNKTTSSVINVGTSCLVINFNKMVAIVVPHAKDGQVFIVDDTESNQQNGSIGKIFQIRRLEPGSLLSEDTFTAWKWYTVNHNGNWQPFDDDTSARIEKALSVTEQNRFQFSNGYDRYLLDLKAMVLENSDTMVKRPVRRRPALHSKEAEQRHLFRINLSIESAYGSEALERLLRPNYWRIACREQLRLGYYELQELSETSERYRDVISIFRRTMKAEKVSVVSVNAVVNVGLWKRYMRKQQTIQVKNKVEEKQLFCATQLSTTDAICKEGFNVNGSGVRICPPTKELPNYYFSRDANHSHIYSRNADDHGNYHVFLSKVLIGSSREKSRFMPRRQITSPSSPCPNPIDDFPVFVVRDADQVYPDILITYRLCL